MVKHNNIRYLEGKISFSLEKEGYFSFRFSFDVKKRVFHQIIRPIATRFLPYKFILLV
ncbi:uncharacterized protein METZ01_LOCUS488868, partial [marine metagenome]